MVILGYYYIQAARNELTPFFRWTLHCRIFFALVVAALVILKLAQPMLLLFGLLDLLGMFWTAMALRSTAHRNAEMQGLDQ